MFTEKQFIETKELLSQLVACPSFSKEEEGTSQIIQAFFQQKNIPFHVHLNNVWAVNQAFDSTKPTVLLNSHHDTVKPNASWTEDPFQATQKAEKLIGLGSNDAGASLVCLISTFCTFYESPDLPFNLVLAATAEEEISGKNGIEALLQAENFPKIDWAIVGEPTDCQLAIAEKGLVVIDAKSVGKAGHAARNEGVNAIYSAIEDILTIKNHSFAKVSNTLGPVKTTVTVIEAGKQHNVVPDVCHFTIDCRVNDCYTLEEVVKELQSLVNSELTPRSLRLSSSKMEETHPVVLAAKELGIERFGSPTLSDQSLLACPSVKIGPGHSGRSHTADEFIYLEELRQGIQTYQKLIIETIKFYPLNSK
jgi:acetylornithine deacetylase